MADTGYRNLQELAYKLSYQCGDERLWRPLRYWLEAQQKAEKIDNFAVSTLGQQTVACFRLVVDSRLKAHASKALGLEAQYVYAPDAAELAEQIKKQVERRVGHLKEMPEWHEQAEALEGFAKSALEDLENALSELPKLRVDADTAYIGQPSPGTNVKQR